MPGIAVGEPAPSFRLPTAQGAEIGLEDFRGQKNVIVWFTKGMACPFCRSQMSQLARAYADIQKPEPGTHNGGGQTIGYSFFDKTPGMKFVFRKRVLHPGAGVGHHEQHEDEVYYVLSGKGVMTVDDKAVDMMPGTAVLTRPGSSHSLKQQGNDDLVVLIAYEIK